MASISIHVNKVGKVFPPIGEGGTCLSIECFGYFEDADDGPLDQCYCRDDIYLHGTVEQLRRFATALLGALPLPKFVAGVVEEETKDAT